MPLCNLHTTDDMLKITLSVSCSQKGPEVKCMLSYLETNVLPEDQKEAHSILLKHCHFVYWMRCFTALIVGIGIEREW